MSQRFLGALQVFQCRIVIWLVLGSLPVGLGFLQILFLGMSCLCDLLQKLVRFRKLPIANKSHCLLNAIVEPIGLVVGEADGLVVLDARLLLIAHQSVGVSQSDLRTDEIWIN